MREFRNYERPAPERLELAPAAGGFMVAAAVDPGGRRFRHVLRSATGLQELEYPALRRAIVCYNEFAGIKHPPELLVSLEAVRGSAAELVKTCHALKGTPSWMALREVLEEFEHDLLLLATILPAGRAELRAVARREAEKNT